MAILADQDEGKPKGKAPGTTANGKAKGKSVTGKDAEATANTTTGRPKKP